MKRPPPLEGTEVGDRAEAEREVVALVPVEMGGGGPGGDGEGEDEETRMPWSERGIITGSIPGYPSSFKC